MTEQPLNYDEIEMKIFPQKKSTDRYNGDKTKVNNNEKETKTKNKNKQNKNIINRDEVLGGDFICILKGYPTILTLEEMEEKAANTHQVDVPREKKISCCLIFVGLLFFIIFFIIYWILLTAMDYSLQDGVIVIIETCCVVSILVMGMCLFRWCSLNDISPKTIWQRVAVTQCNPLRLIKFDMENVNISFVEYNLDYGEYPNNLHEPIITLTRQEQICNARDLVKITKKEPNPDEAYSYGAIYFHFKGKDEYLLDRWKYEFEKYHNKVGLVHKKCNKFHSVFFQHFGYKFRYKVIEDNERKTDDEGYDDIPKSKYLSHKTTLREKEDDVMGILDSFNPPKSKVPPSRSNIVEEEEEDDDDYYYNTHELDGDDSSTDENQRNMQISPILLGGAKRSNKNTSNKQKKNNNTSSNNQKNNTKQLKSPHSDYNAMEPAPTPTDEENQNRFVD